MLLFWNVFEHPFLGFDLKTHGETQLWLWKLQAGGMTFLEIAALGNSEDFASLLLSVGAGGKARGGSILWRFVDVGRLQ